MFRCAGLVIVLTVASLTTTAEELENRHALGQPICRSLATAVDAASKDGQPVFLASYRPGPSESALPLPLRSSAFSYDNALAVIALVSCGALDQGRRIGEAFLHAIDHDRSFRDGRIRNAYRAGIVQSVSLLPGWWEPAIKGWAEDGYQNGTATGNVAWVALALLTLADTTDDARYLAATRTLMDWVKVHTGGTAGAGVTGGVDGFDPVQTRLAWKSTEHNLDVYAAALWYGRATGDQRFIGLMRSSRAFLDEAFLEQPGCFALGREPDGRMNGSVRLALDTQLWPVLAVPDGPPAWRRALACAETRMTVAGGFDFNEDRDGLWVEGTAQAALTYQVVGQRTRANELLNGLTAELAPSGWLYATREERLTTGLRIGPGSTSEDFFYFRRPHLGATAWAALAANRWNPFVSRRFR
ncbi:hypothetical protein [Ensifer sp.]|jgi:hypothetical protein|uniref:hypothetical protein n=1 Tax=Ensifer sp. TaxID=1872086 RepID=UPI002E11906E